MRVQAFFSKNRRLLPFTVTLAAILAVGLGILLISVASANGPSTPLNPLGYLDFTYATTISPTLPPAHMTGEKAESKLWWNDGFWWGSLYKPNETDPLAGEYHIFRLNWGTQTWEDTGVALDDRDDSKADTLWVPSTKKLYVVSHLYTTNSSKVGKIAINAGRLYRYSYNDTTETYTLDPGFPVTVNEDKTETLVLDRDSTGRLWVTYVSRVPPSTDYQVYVNATTGSDLSWGTPFSLGTITGSAHVDVDDISSLIAFRDDGGDKIGVMWSNGISGTLNFATHSDSTADPASGWSVSDIPLPANTSADDHISIKMRQTSTSGQIFAAIKMKAVNNTDPLVGMVTRDGDGTFSFHSYSTKVDDDTRPILVIDEGNPASAVDDKVYLFVTGKESGSKICYKTLSITTPLSSMGNFQTGDCGTSFIEDATSYANIDDPTSTKQSVNSTTGMVILASDAVNGQVYVHNVMGDPPPVITARTPGIGATNVPRNTQVMSTFSKPMNAATLNSTNFTVKEGANPVTGTLNYDVPSRTVTFTPSSLLNANTVYTVTLNANVKDTGGHALFGAPVSWNFTTSTKVLNFAYMPVMTKNP